MWRYFRVWAGVGRRAYAVGETSCHAPPREPHVGVPDRRSFMRRFTLSCALAAAVGVLPSVGGWVVMSLIFSWYVTSVADYGSIFGSLATVIVAME